MVMKTEPIYHPKPVRHLVSKLKKPSDMGEPHDVHKLMVVKEPDDGKRRVSEAKCICKPKIRYTMDYFGRKPTSMDANETLPKYPKLR
ncbi:hypothetical protein JTB14_029273 [Gonioctena quinquepunctata]|nr:hypothetical protein JTB14_029273 [Gonioctena quinquepunctata]